MATTITKWGCSITEAASRAADYSGFSAETARLWASSFIISTSTIVPDNTTDEYITEQLTTNHGAHDTHTGSLLHDDHFQLAARSYVQKQACRKGAPNLTSKMFATGLRVNMAKGSMTTQHVGGLVSLDLQEFTIRREYTSMYIIGMM